MRNWLKLSLFLLILLLLLLHLPLIITTTSKITTPVIHLLLIHHLYFPGPRFLHINYNFFLIIKIGYYFHQNYHIFQENYLYCWITYQFAHFISDSSWNFY
jgi:hypothetical protein